MIYKSRQTSQLDGDFAVFLIGLRINALIRVNQWLPVIRAMGGMLTELYEHPDLGFIHAESWFARTTLMVQYWRSSDQLLSYATNRDARHLPAWQAFNRRASRTGAVGIWHETYLVSRGGYEAMYVNMPRFGLGKAGQLLEARGVLQFASDRLGTPRVK